MPLSTVTACIFQQGSWQGQCDRLLQGSKGVLDVSMLVCSPIRAAAATEGRLELHFETNFKKDMGGRDFFGP